MTEPNETTDLVEAPFYQQWDGTEENAHEIIAWIDPTVTSYFQKEFPPIEDSIVVSTPYGNARARKGDYIVLTPDEGYRVAKSYVFEQELAEAETETE